MRIILLVVSVALIGIAGPIMAKTVTQSRDVPPFSKVIINGSIDAKITVGQEQSVKIRADDREIDRIKTTVKDDTLTIHTKGSFRRSDDLQTTITVPSLSAISINGSADADIYNINSDQFHIGISGSGDVSASGRCGSARYGISGSGDISAESLQCDTVSVGISGSGDADVYASSEISIAISGSGDVTAAGRPTVKKVAISGSASFVMKD